MELKTIHCFLVHPAKHEKKQPNIGGTSVPDSGSLYTMLKNIFDNINIDCRTDISFNHNDNGIQQNDCRDLLLTYLKSHGVENGREIALRLQGFTNMKSGLGLLFLMLGSNGTRSRLVLSRFPADQGILAEESKNSLTVEFLEKIFMKSATAYKAAVYEGEITTTAFWTGKAIDKQINHSAHEVANYWVRDFLASDLRTTAAAGTRRLALALRSAMKDITDAKAKAEIVAAVTLASSLDGKTTSAQEFCHSFNLDQNTTNAVHRAVKHTSLMEEEFQFDAAEFKLHIAFRSVELSNGGVLTAEASKFDEVFHQEPLGQTDSDSEIRFITQGEIVDQRLRKGKI